MILVAIMLFACQVPQEEPTNVGSGRTSASDNGDGGNESGDKGVEAHFKSPDSSRVLQPGGVLAIEWFYFPNFVKEVTINLWGTGKDPKEEKFIFTITTIQQFNFNSGVYKYDLPLNFFEDVGKEYEVDKFKVEIIDKKNEYSEKCDIFEINPIKFENPTRNENDVPTEWFSGESANIEWIAAGIPANADYAKMKIIGRKVGSWDWEDVYLMTEYDLDPSARQATNSGTYTWNIPETFHETYCVEMGFREDSFKIVREIYDVDNNLIVSGTSRGFIKIDRKWYEWLFMVYVSEDNDLDPDVELGYVWKLKNRIYFNPSARNKIKTIIIDDDTDRGTTAFDANTYSYIDINSLGISSNPFEKTKLDMGDPENLKKFMEFCLTNYISTRKALFLTGHGGRMDGICSDMHFSSNITPKPETNNLTPHEIQEVLNTVLDNYKLDVLGLDACSMSALEVAYEFKDYARYLYASPDIGCFIYKYWPRLFEGENFRDWINGNGLTYVTKVVDIFNPDYKSLEEECGTSKDCPNNGAITLTAMNLKKAEYFAQLIYNLGNKLDYEIFQGINYANPDVIKELIALKKEGLEDASYPKYDNGTENIDLLSLCWKICKKQVNSNYVFSLALRDAAKNVLENCYHFILRATAYESYTNGFSGFYDGHSINMANEEHFPFGISLFFGETLPDYYNNPPEEKKLDFCFDENDQDKPWNAFIRKWVDANYNLNKVEAVYKNTSGYSSQPYTDIQWGPDFEGGNIQLWQIDENGDEQWKKDIIDPIPSVADFPINGFSIYNGCYSYKWYPENTILVDDGYFVRINDVDTNGNTIKYHPFLNTFPIFEKPKVIISTASIGGTRNPQEIANTQIVNSINIIVIPPTLPNSGIDIHADITKPLDYILEPDNGNGFKFWIYLSNYNEGGFKWGVDVTGADVFDTPGANLSYTAENGYASILITCPDIDSLSAGTTYITLITLTVKDLNYKSSKILEYDDYGNPVLINSKTITISLTISE